MALLYLFLFGSSSIPLLINAIWAVSVIITVEHLMIDFGSVVAAHCFPIENHHGASQQAYIKAHNMQVVHVRRRPGHALQRVPRRATAPGCFEKGTGNFLATVDCLAELPVHVARVATLRMLGKPLTVAHGPGPAVSLLFAAKRGARGASAMLGSRCCVPCGTQGASLSTS